MVARLSICVFISTVYAKSWNPSQLIHATYSLSRASDTALLRYKSREQAKTTLRIYNQRLWSGCWRMLTCEFGSSHVSIHNTEMLACIARKLIGIGHAEIDLLALWDEVALMLDIKHGLRSIGWHHPIRAEDGHLVLQRRYVEGLVTGIVVRWHHVSNLLCCMGMHPL